AVENILPGRVHRNRRGVPDDEDGDEDGEDGQATVHVATPRATRPSPLSPCGSGPAILRSAELRGEGGSPPLACAWTDREPRIRPSGAPSPARGEGKLARVR